MDYNFFNFEFIRRWFNDLQCKIDIISSTNRATMRASIGFPPVLLVILVLCQHTAEAQSRRRNNFNREVTSNNPKNAQIANSVLEFRKWDSRSTKHRTDLSVQARRDSNLPFRPRRWTLYWYSQASDQRSLSDDGFDHWTKGNHKSFWRSVCSLRRLWLKVVLVLYRQYQQYR